MPVKAVIGRAGLAHELQGIDSCVRIAGHLPTTAPERHLTMETVATLSPALLALAKEAAPHLFRAARLRSGLYGYPCASLNVQVSGYYAAVGHTHAAALRLSGPVAAADMLRVAYCIADTMHGIDPEAIGEDPEELDSLLREAVTVAARHTC